MEFEFVVPLRIRNASGRPNSALIETALLAMKTDRGLTLWPGLEAALDEVYGSEIVRGNARWRYRNFPPHSIADVLLAFRLTKSAACRLVQGTPETTSCLVPVGLSPDDLPAFVEDAFSRIHDGSAPCPSGGWWQGDWIWRRALKMKPSGFSFARSATPAT